MGDNTIQCPKCGYENNTSAIECDKCGVTLSLVLKKSAKDDPVKPLDTGQTPADEGSDLSVCPKCGHEIVPSSEECIKCGIIFSKFFKVQDRRLKETQEKLDAEALQQELEEKEAQEREKAIARQKQAEADEKEKAEALKKEQAEKEKAEAREAEQRQKEQEALEKKAQRKKELAEKEEAEKAAAEKAEQAQKEQEEKDKQAAEETAEDEAAAAEAAAEIVAAAEADKQALGNLQKEFANLESESSFLKSEAERSKAAEEEALKKNEETQQQLDVVTQGKEDLNQKVESLKKERDALQEAEDLRKETESAEKKVQEEIAEALKLERKDKQKRTESILKELPPQPNFEKLLQKYEGQEIGINYDDPAEIKKAQLAKVNEDHFSVLVMENELLYSYPFSNILSIVEAMAGVPVDVSGETANYPIVVRVLHLMVKKKWSFM